MTPITFTTFSDALDQIGFLVAKTDKGICALYLGFDEDELIEDLQRDFKGAALVANSHKMADEVTAVLNLLRGAITENELNMPLDIQGTDFELSVWTALADIPYGQTRTYGEIAEQVGKPKAARAVGNACGANKVSLLVPCHRVIASDGSIHNYRWGTEVKKMILALEDARERSREDAVNMNEIGVFHPSSKRPDAAMVA